MQEKISKCKKCDLCKNQPPIISPIREADIIIIGISSQKNSETKVFTPLDSSTNSGKFISLLENSMPDKTFYKTNLVKCAPLNSGGKIRYPSQEELEKCFSHLENEIEMVKPKIIITLGNQVASFVSEKFGIKLEKYVLTKFNGVSILPIDHPSYIMIYKRKQLEQYKNRVVGIIKNMD